MDFICNDCPRRCNAARRDSNGDGFCRCGMIPQIVRAAPHFGEEPCISGTNGSGAIFFSGCNMHCVFCQNQEISITPKGFPIHEDRFIELLYQLQDLNVHNINLVTPSHHTRFIAKCLRKTKLNVPIVWNSSGYESTELLKELDGLISIYLPDFKYATEVPAEKYSRASDYPSVAKAAIKEMYRQTGPYRIDDNGILQKGVLIRHLIMPGEINNSKCVIDWVSSEFKTNEILFSLMSQYTPMSFGYNEKYNNLNRKITNKENTILINYMNDCGITNGYVQALDSSTKEMIPAFDGTGVN